MRIAKPWIVLFVAGAACTRRDAEDPSTAQGERSVLSPEAASSQAPASSQQELARDRTKEQMDLKSPEPPPAPGPEGVPPRAAPRDSVAIEDHKQYDTDLAARLDELDMRIAAVKDAFTSAKGDMRTKAGKLVRTIREERSRIDSARSTLRQATPDDWDAEHTDFEHDLKALDAHVEELEKTLQTSR
jgi:hypothetical protein